MNLPSNDVAPGKAPTNASLPTISLQHSTYSIALTSYGILLYACAQRSWLTGVMP